MCKVVFALKKRKRKTRQTPQPVLIKKKKSRGRGIMDLHGLVYGLSQEGGLNGSLGWSLGRGSEWLGTRDGVEERAVNSLFTCEY